MNRPASLTLDARSLSPATKTDQIVESFDKLQIGTALEINEETDPRALRNEMTQLRAGRFSWDARNLGSNRWTIRLERIDENADQIRDLRNEWPPRVDPGAGSGAQAGPH